VSRGELMQAAQSTGAAIFNDVPSSGWPCKTGDAIRPAGRPLALPLGNEARSEKRWGRDAQGPDRSGQGVSAWVRYIRRAHNTDNGGRQMFCTAVASPGS
jgi:hypothetical protein